MQVLVNKMKVLNGMNNMLSMFLQHLENAKIDQVINAGKPLTYEKRGLNSKGEFAMLSMNNMVSLVCSIQKMLKLNCLLIQSQCQRIWVIGTQPCPIRGQLHRYDPPLHYVIPSNAGEPLKKKRKSTVSGSLQCEKNLDLSIQMILEILCLCLKEVQGTIHCQGTH